MQEEGLSVDAIMDGECADPTETTASASKSEPSKKVDDDKDRILKRGDLVRIIGR